MVKKKILEEAIISLQNEGLKFSVDTLAQKLKISKKTLYKYFPSKEALALELYRQYYQTAGELIANSGACFSTLLHIYFDSKRMTQNEIFNKYELNEAIRSYAEQHHEAIWSAVCAALPPALSEGGRAAVRVIIDGTFEKLCKSDVDPEMVIERLVTLVC